MSSVHGGGDEEARERLVCSVCGVDWVNDYCEHADDDPVSADRAGERADAIPAKAIEAAAQALCAWPSVKVDDREHNTATHMATDALLAATPFLRAAQPEAGNEEAERLPCRRCRGKGYVRRADSEAVRCPECRAAHPEADRAPETDEPTDGAFSRHGVSVDRAPGEVDEVYRLLERTHGDPDTNDGVWRNGTWKRRTKNHEVIASVIDALDAVRGRSRDDTATLLAEALKVAADDLGKAANQFEAMRQSQEAGYTVPISVNPRRFAEKEARAREVLARFGGAGRAETEEENR